MNTRDNLVAWLALSITADTGSISETAKRMHLELSKVSRLLSSLEDEMGFAFFDKSHRPLEPTAQCLSLLTAVRPHLQGLRVAAQTFRVNTDSAPIRFSSPIEIMRLYFSDLLMHWSETHPGISFSMHAEATLEDLLARRVDVAVLNQIPDNTRDLVVRHYRTATTFALATPQYLRRFGTPQTPADLVRHTGLLLQTVNLVPTSRLYSRGAPSDILRWKNCFFSHDQMALKQLLLEHRGITVDLALGHALDGIRNGTIVRVLPEWERAPWHMCFVTRKTLEDENPMFTTFCDWIAAKTAQDWNRLSDDARSLLGTS